jgi:tripartite-type tricarboxylate transporter receptor subunit TctC
MRPPLRSLAYPLLAAMVGLAGVSPVARAADYPEKTIRLVVPFASGGGVDALARPLAKELGDILKQSVVVENKASATGQIGAADVARSAPDGYTLLISSTAFGATPAFYPKSPYNAVKDFEAVTIIASTPQVLVANAAFKPSNVQELLRASRAGEPVKFALTATTGIQALATELLSSMGQVTFNKIPYKGAGPAITDLLGGQVDVMIDNPSSSMPHVRSGKLKLLATTGLKRMSVLPDVPTVAEVLPGFEALNWFVLAAPANTPPAILERLRAATNEAIKRPLLRQIFERDGLSPVMSTHAEAQEFVASEVTKWTRIVKERGLQME